MKSSHIHVWHPTHAETVVQLRRRLKDFSKSFLMQKKKKAVFLRNIYIFSNVNTQTWPQAKHTLHDFPNPKIAVLLTAHILSCNPLSYQMCCKHYRIKWRPSTQFDELSPGGNPDKRLLILARWILWTQQIGKRRQRALYVVVLPKPNESGLKLPEKKKT